MNTNSLKHGSAVRLQWRGVGISFAFFGICFVLACVQLLLGGETGPSMMLAGATYFGLLAVHEAGALTALGILNLVLLGRMLLGAYVAKNVILLQPITADLLAPESTAAVMLLGFLAVWLATALTRRFVPTIPWFTRHSDVNHLRSILLLMLFASVISSVAVRFNAGDTGEALTGGVWGIAKALNSVRNLSLPVLMLYLWRLGTHRWLMHPATLALLALLFIIGVLSSSKQAMAEPILFFILMAIARYGWRHPIGWVVVPIGILIFQFFIYPISQYARNAGGTYKDPVEAAIATGDIVASYITEPSFREYVMQHATSGGHWDDGTAYLPEKLVAMGRVALVGEADRLISASDVYEFTGWDTITNSILLAVPHFLLPNKPQSGSGNYLARYSGDLPPTDTLTQVSYGFMANAYNAFGMSWVFPLSFITSLLVLVPIALISSGRAFDSPWTMFAIVSIHQTYVESSFSGLFGAVNLVILACILFLATVAIDWISQKHRERQSTVPPPSQFRLHRRVRN